MQKINQWHQFDSAELVAAAVCEQIIGIAERAINDRGCFKIVLAGGSTPAKIYQQLVLDQSYWYYAKI